jgi:hypothetical protein
MAIGGGIFLIVTGVLVATVPGAQPGRADMRYAGLVMTALGLVVLWLAIVSRNRSAWRLERRRATYARMRAVRRPRYPRRRAASSAPAVVSPAPSAAVIAPVPEQPLSSLGQIVSLVDQTQKPGQHGRRPPSPRGRWRYPF